MDVETNHKHKTRTDLLAKSCSGGGMLAQRAINNKEIFISQTRGNIELVNQFMMLFLVIILFCFLFFCFFVFCFGFVLFFL